MKKIIIFFILLLPTFLKTNQKNLNQKNKALIISERCRKCSYLFNTDGARQIFLQPCGHDICNECFGYWKNKHGKICPECKIKVTSIIKAPYEPIDHC